MQYRTGSIGRVMVVKFEDGDGLLDGIIEVARKEQVGAGFFFLLGGMRSAGMVCGPKEPVLPPEPSWESFTDGREVLGIGSVFLKDGEPAVHLHGAVGKFDDTLAGCIRKDDKVFLVVEAMLMEVTGVNAAKAVNEKTGIAMLEFS
ncbi:MAG TPA: PPC domain-containing DNA-binding protein [Nitrospirota bacterium]|nr:PPC domain-containing DNA-binding protein [Nitrospirota bacterium]